MKPSFLLVFNDMRWHVARVADQQVELRDVAAEEDAPAAGVKATLQQWGHNGQGVCLAPGSEMVLSATIDCDGLPRAQRRNAMLFRFEEQLPLDVENLTVDFLPPAGGRTLGVAAEVTRLRELIDPLADAGVETAAICPTALLALWDLCQNCQGCDYAIVAWPGKIDVFRLGDDQPMVWYTVDDDDAEELIRCIQADQLAQSPRAEQATACVIAEEDWFLQALEDELELTIAHYQEEPALKAAARAAERVLAGGEAGWIELRRDALAPVNPWGRLAGLLRSAVALGLLLAVVLATVFCWRGIRYAASADLARREQAAAYRELYPRGRMPGSVKSRMASELRHLAGISGATAEVPPQVSALDSLRRVMANLPTGVQLRILEMHIGPNDIFIEGQTLRHRDAEAFESSLGRGGFHMEPPRTERIPTGGVTFTLAGSLPAEGNAQTRPEGP